MRKKSNWPLTIAPELFGAWQKMKRKKDPQVMAEALGVSRPLLTRALNFGNVTKEGLVEQINTFFKTRLEAEKDAAKDFQSMTDLSKVKK